MMGPHIEIFSALWDKPNPAPPPQCHMERPQLSSLQLPPLVQHLIPFHHAETLSSTFSSFSIPHYLSSLHVEKTCSHASSLPSSSKHNSPLIVSFKRSACNGSLSVCFPLRNLSPSYKEIQQHEIPWYLNSLSHLSFACFIYFCLATTQKQQLLLLLLCCPRQSLLMQK